MSNITNTDAIVTEQKLTEFYEEIKPYLGCPAYLTQDNGSDYYSTTEKVVGRWTDGKPLYQKVISDTFPNAVSTNKRISIGANIDKGMIVCGFLVDSYGSLIPLPFCTNASFSTFCRAILCNNSHAQNANSVLVTTTTDTWLNMPFFIVIQYTKTTDSSTTAIEQKSSHYSTTEQVVGTWIDGKPIYQKTVNFGALPSDTNAKSVAHNISNLKSFIKIEGIAQNGTIGAPIPLTSTGSTPAVDQITIYTNDTNIVIASGKDRSSYNAYVTIQYTKTTD